MAELMAELKHPILSSSSSLALYILVHNLTQPLDAEQLSCASLWTLLYHLGLSLFETH